MMMNDDDDDDDHDHHPDYDDHDYVWLFFSASVFRFWHLKVFFIWLFKPGVELILGQGDGFGLWSKWLCVESTKGFQFRQPGTNSFVIGKHDNDDVWTK